MFLTKKFLLLALFAAGPVWGAVAENVEPARLQATLIERNPEIKAALQKWRVADQQSHGAASWPNPTLGYIEERDPSGEDGVDPMSRHHLNVQQTIPFPGKLSNEARMKGHEASIAEETYEQTRLDTAKRLRVALAALERVQRLQTLAVENKQAMRAMLGSAQARLSTGKSSTAEVLLLEAEVGRMDNMVFEKSQERRQAEIELNTLLDWPLDTTWPVVTSSAAATVLPALPEIQQLAQNKSPILRSAAHEQNHARAMLQRNKLEYAPDFGVMYEYQTAGDGFRGVGPAGRQLGLSLSVPLWLTRPNALLRAGRAHEIEAEANATAMRNMVGKMVAMEYAETETHRTLAANYEKRIVPATRAAWAAAREQVAAGQMDFMRFLDVNHAWIQANEEHADEAYHAVEHKAELEMWVGGEINEK